MRESVPSQLVENESKVEDSKVILYAEMTAPREEGRAHEIITWNYTKMCFKILYFSRVRNWLGPIFSAAIIMIFVSCTIINEYVRNYQDCLTLGGERASPSTLSKFWNDTVNVRNWHQ
jgi:hypothetical protein